jgi:hypothetical protein
MGLLKLLQNVTGLVDTWLKGKRGRLRGKIRKLEKEEKEILDSKPSVKRSEKLKYVRDKLKEYKQQLMEKS